MTGEPAVAVVDVAEAARYELRVDGRRAGLADYRDVGNRRVVTHSEVDEGFQGQGLASRLVAEVVDDVRRHGRSLTPLCPFVVRWLERHPEAADVVDPDHPGGMAG